MDAAPADDAGGGKGGKGGGKGGKGGGKGGADAATTAYFDPATGDEATDEDPATP
jgi:hypothetical protein